MSVLVEIQAAADEALRAHAVPEPGSSRFEQMVEDPDRLFTLEAVYEGYLMHYGTPRAFTRMDEDLRLLAGDALYALGLARLATRGDVEAVTELSDLISLTAQAHAEGRPRDAGVLWRASAEALSASGGPGVRSAAEASPKGGSAP